MVKKTYQIKNLVKKYKAILLNNNIKPEKIILYGSFAYGKPKEWSDIDLVVIAKSFGNINPITRMEFLSQKAAEVDDSLEVLGYTTKEFNGTKDSIFKEIIQKGKEI